MKLERYSDIDEEKNCAIEKKYNWLSNEYGKYYLNVNGVNKEIRVQQSLEGSLKNPNLNSAMRTFLQKSLDKVLSIFIELMI